MQGQMPQEIEVWYIIPALRRELAKAMLELKLTQKQIAEIMGVTEAAISQYLHSKRGKEVVFSKAVLKEIKAAAARIVDNPKEIVPEMVSLSKNTGVMQVMCDLHRKQDANTPKGCDICFDENLIEVKK